MSNCHVDAVLDEPLRAWGGTEITSGHKVAGFLQKICDASHAYAADPSEMISFCHKISSDYSIITIQCMTVEGSRLIIPSNEIATCGIIGRDENES